MKKAVRRERAKHPSKEILSKYFDDVDVHSLNGNQNFMSVFGEHHRKQQRAVSEDRLANKALMQHVVEPIQGLDILHEDSKAETQSYQDIYDSVLIKEVN